MKIGLFTDTYRPAQNGVVVVIDVTRRELEAMGHEVYVFAPSANLLNKVAEVDADDDHLIHFPTIRGAGFKEGQLSIFFPPQLLTKVRELKIDILHFFTAGQMAMFCCYAAKKTGAVLIGQHCTDTYEYSDNYRLLKFGYAAMAPLMAAAVEMPKKQKLNFATAYTLKQSDEKWGKRLVSAMIAAWYQACDTTIAVSQKSANQLEDIAKTNDASFNLEIVPTGVDAPTPCSKEDIASLQSKYGLTDKDEVIIYYGRLGQEKNLALLIDVIEIVAKERPHAKLVYAGDWEYRETLEKLAQDSPVKNKIIFTGKYQRNEISILNSISKIYAFPSLTDTQGLVVTEAAHGGLPIVLCDPLAPACFAEGENGLTANNDPRDFANKIITILSDKKLYTKFSANSKKLASELTERRQTEKLVDIYRSSLRNK